MKFKITGPSEKGRFHLYRWECTNWSMFYHSIYRGKLYNQIYLMEAEEKVKEAIRLSNQLIYTEEEIEV